ncbi:MAG: hypothetical protein KY468_01825 [Armatimonadetes bacterium]|nr:hypothetical protein [Armatimonadota bacterium]
MKRYFRLNLLAVLGFILFVQGVSLAQSTRFEVLSDEEIHKKLGHRPGSPSSIGIPVFPKGYDFWQTGYEKPKLSIVATYEYKVRYVSHVKIINYYVQELTDKGWNLKDKINHGNLKEGFKRAIFTRAKNRKEEVLIIAAGSHRTRPITEVTVQLRKKEMSKEERE